jgi:hypothetical protein
MRAGVVAVGLVGCLIASGASGGGNANPSYPTFNATGTTTLAFEGVSLTCATAAAGAGCNINGCWRNGGGCNSYGCWSSPDGSCNINGCSDIGVCSSYGCPKGAPRVVLECCVAGETPPSPGGCNSYGCWTAGGGCNVYGCFSNGGGCNSYGCWNHKDGACNFNGCSDLGPCSSYGCPKGPPRATVSCASTMLLAENRFATTRASCNAFGCWEYGGGCNTHGCWRSGGGCNAFGCWHSPQGACNTYGCSDAGVCSIYGCPKGGVSAWTKVVK